MSDELIHIFQEGNQVIWKEIFVDIFLLIYFQKAFGDTCKLFSWSWKHWNVDIALVW